MAWSDGISGVHAEIAAELRSPVHVLAGPGTGKTTAMMRRVARLLEAGADPKRILAVTFTRTAARDLERQLGDLNVAGADGVNAATLHSLCFSALLAEAVFQATGRRARPLLSHEIDQLVNDLRKGAGGKRKVQRLLEAYEAAWARLQEDDPGHPKSAADVAFETALMDWLRYHGALLVGELVPITLRFLQDNPHAAVLPAYDSVLVDEYQDLNKADQALVDVVATGGTLTVIGDDNQSIYGFRHANPKGIRTFPETHAGTVQYVIDECWRCPPNIVRISNALISSDPDVRAGLPKPQSGRADASVYVVQHDTIPDEADAIAAFIEHYLTNHPNLPAGQVLVLSPRRMFGNAVRDALIQRRMNAASFFWEDALSSGAAAEGFCLLTLRRNKLDRAAYRAWLGLGQANGYAAGYKRVRKYAEANNLEPFDVVSKLLEGSLDIPFTDGIKARHRLLAERLKAIEGVNGLPLVDHLWPESADNQTIRQMAAPLALDIEDPNEFLERLTESITRPELPDATDDIIRIMSLHKSKGLTAELVVVVGCVAGALPSIDTDLPQPVQDAVLKEQRRLFYVALTRAKNTLVLSYVRRMSIDVALQNGVTPARFARVDGAACAITLATPFLRECGRDLPATETGSAWRTRLEI